MAAMDIPQILAVLKPNDDWGPCAQTGSTYEQFAAKWRGASACPTKQEMQAAWAAIEAGLAEKQTPAWQLAADKAIVADLIDGIDRPDAQPRHLTRALRVTMRAVQAVVANLRTKTNEIITKSPIGSAIRNIDQAPSFTFTQLRAIAKQKNDAEASPTED